MSNSLRSRGRQHARLSCAPPSPGVCFGRAYPLLSWSLKLWLQRAKLLWIFLLRLSLQNLLPFENCLFSNSRFRLPMYFHYCLFLEVCGGGSLSNAVNHYSLEVGAKEGLYIHGDTWRWSRSCAEREREMVLWLCAVFVSSPVGYLPHDCGNFCRPLYK